MLVVDISAFVNWMVVTAITVVCTILSPLRFRIVIAPGTDSTKNKNASQNLLFIVFRSTGEKVKWYVNHNWKFNSVFPSVCLKICKI